MKTDIIGMRADVKARYRRLYGPYTVYVVNGVVHVWRHSWRKGVYQEYDYDRNLREIKFPGTFKAERLPQ